MKAGLEPATRPQIAAELGRLALVYASSRRTEDEWRMLFDIYAEDLREIPYDILKHACACYRRDPANKFFPAPGQIIEHCEEPLARRRSDLAGLELVNEKKFTDEAVA